MVKKAVQQGRRDFGTRSVHGKVRERARREERQVCVPEGDKSPRTQLAIFSALPEIKKTEEVQFLYPLRSSKR